MTLALTPTLTLTPALSLCAADHLRQRRRRQQPSRQRQRPHAGRAPCVASVSPCRAKAGGPPVMPRLEACLSRQGWRPACHAKAGGLPAPSLAACGLSGGNKRALALAPALTLTLTLTRTRTRTRTRTLPLPGGLSGGKRSFDVAATRSRRWPDRGGRSTCTQGACTVRVRASRAASRCRRGVIAAVQPAGSSSSCSCAEHVRTYPNLTCNPNPTPI